MDPMLDCVVDVSHWQPPASCDYHAARQSGILGLIVKVSQGTAYVDPAARDHIKRGRDAGLLLGAYHFLTGENGGDQADHFLDAAADAFELATDAPFDGYLLALDWERNTGPGGQGGPVQAHDFVAALADYEPHLVLYGNPVKSLGYHNVTPNVLGLDLWLPKYGQPPSDASAPPWTMRKGGLKLWQHTDGHVGFKPGSVPGMGRVDRSIWFGDEAELRAWWGHQTQAATPAQASAVA